MGEMLFVIVGSAACLQSVTLVEVKVVQQHGECLRGKRPMISHEISFDTEVSHEMTHCRTGWSHDTKWYIRIFDRIFCGLKCTAL